PLSAAQPAQCRRRISHADVARDAIELVRRNVEAIGAGVLDQQVLALDTVVGELDEALEASNAVVLVHDEVTRPELREEGGWRNVRAPLLTTPLRPAKDLGVGVDGQRE